MYIQKIARGHYYLWWRIYSDILTERLDFKADMVVSGECTWTDEENKLHTSLYDDEGGEMYDGY